MITEVPVSFTMYVPSVEFGLCWMILGMMTLFISLTISSVIWQNKWWIKDRLSVPYWLTLVSIIVSVLVWPYVIY